jgi:hypothetical protein
MGENPPHFAGFKLPMLNPLRIIQPFIAAWRSAAKENKARTAIGIHVPVGGDIAMGQMIPAIKNNPPE